MLTLGLLCSNHRHARALGYSLVSALALTRGRMVFAQGHRVLFGVDQQAALTELEPGWHSAGAAGSAR